MHFGAIPSHFQIRKELHFVPLDMQLRRCTCKALFFQAPPTPSASRDALLVLTPTKVSTLRRCRILSINHLQPRHPLSCWAAPLPRSQRAGDCISQTLHLPSGLRYVATLPDTEQGNALAIAARRGDVTQSSFAFTIAKQRFEQHEGKPLRIIERIGSVLDVSPVVYPAYKGTEFHSK